MINIKSKRFAIVRAAAVFVPTKRISASSSLYVPDLRDQESRHDPEVSSGSQLMLANDHIGLT
jgi:hypothetical protein